MSKKETEHKVETEQELTDNLTEDMSSADKLSEELALMKDQYMRLMAEYDNYRKRTVKEKSELIKNGGERVLLGLLPVIDDFERAIKTIDKSEDVASIREGVDLIYHKFMSYLEQNGVKPIETIGNEFDPDMYEAVATVPAQDEDQKGKVIDNMETGYTLHDKVIRHAKVVVAN